MTSEVEHGLWSGADPRIVTLRRERDEALAALAVAREREQRHRGALQQIANHNVRAPVTGTSADDPCDWHCTAQQRDLARAALVDEPAAATLAEEGGRASNRAADAPSLAGWSPVGGASTEPSDWAPSSASAAADEPGETP